MSEGPSSYTFGDLVRETARWLGVAPYVDGKPELPKRPADLDDCINIVREAWMGVVAAHDWVWLKNRAETTIKQGEYFGEMPWMFEGQTHGSNAVYQGYNTPRIVVEIVAAQVVHEAIADQPSTAGDPTLIGFETVKSELPSTRRRWRSVVFPKPTQDRTIVVPVRVVASGNFGLDDYHAAGVEHDHLILQACKARAERWQAARTGQGYPGPEAQEFATSLRDAIMRDRKARQANLGTLKRGGEGGAHVPRHTSITMQGNQLYP